MNHPGFFPRLRLALLWPALAALAVATPLFWTLSRSPLEKISSELLLETIGLIEPEIRELHDRIPETELQEVLQKLLGTSELRISIINEDGRVVADTSVASSRIPQLHNHRSRPEVIQAFAGESGTSIRTSSTTGLEYLYVARVIECRDHAPWVLRVARKIERGQSLHRGIGSAALLALLAALLVVATITFWLDRMLVVPFKRLVDGAQLLSAGHFDHRVSEPEALELLPLAKSLNHLATEVQSTIDQLASERDHLREILGTLSDGILVIDERGEARLQNEAFEILMGPAESDSPRIRKQRPALGPLISRALSDREAQQQQIEIQDPVRILRVTALPLPDASGVVVAVHDETDTMRLAESRKDLVANVSHELKTPLTAIRGFAETLQDGALEDPPIAARFTSRIIEQCQRLEFLLRDLLSLSRIESLEVVPEAIEVDLAAMTRQALEILDREIESKEMTIEIESDHGLKVFGDPAGLEQMVLNLLENAVKYSRSKGRVEVRIHRHGGEVVYEISDDGIGIPPADLGRVFERFYRVDKARSRERGGTGLGLAIVKHVVLRHSGRIDVESRVGVGSTFKVYLAEAQPLSAELGQLDPT